MRKASSADTSVRKASNMDSEEGKRRDNEETAIASRALEHLIFSVGTFHFIEILDFSCLTFLA